MKYQDQVFNLALRILGNQETAEDVAQNAFILAFQKIYQFHGDAFHAWLLKIATNLCYDEIRTWRRHPQQPLEPIDQDGKTHESPYWLKDSKPLPEDALETSDLRNALEHGLSQLPLNFRSVVTLVDVHEMNYKDASSATGISMGTLKSRLSRGHATSQYFAQCRKTISSRIFRQHSCSIKPAKGVFHVSNSYPNFNIPRQVQCEQIEWRFDN